MNRAKRIASCPNLSSKSSRTRDRELVNFDVLRKIQRQYELCSPRILGHPLKLTDLFTSVVIRGGYRSVCDRRLWPEIANELNLPSSCTNSGVGLRCIYHRFLIRFEVDEYPTLAKNYLTQLYNEFSSDPIEKELSFIPATSIERNLGISHSDVFGNPSLHSGHHSLTDLRSSQNTQDVPRLSIYFDKSCPNTFDQSCDPDQTSATSRSHSNDSLHLRDPAELLLAELALSSGLPNEVDGALNSLLILSTTPCPSTCATTSIRLPHCRNLLNLILATVGIYTDGLGSFDACDANWKSQTQLDFSRFWHNMVREPEGRLFLNPDVFINPGSDDGPSGSASSVLHELFAPPISTCHSRYEITEEAEASRVFLVATLLVNLVTPSPLQSSKYSDDDLTDYDFDVTAPRCASLDFPPLPAWRENSRFLASSPTALRFVFLCSYAQQSGLRQLGLQILSSLRYQLDPPSSYSICVACPSEWTPLADFGCRLGGLTLSFINRCILDSPDRASLLGGLHFLSNLATVPEKANESSLMTGLLPIIWPRFAQLLCLPDLAVVCATLEVLCCLTNLGQYVCASAWQACLDWSHPVGTVPLILLRPLLALLTLEGQAMGSRSLHRIKVMPRSIRTTFPSSHLPIQQQPVLCAPYSAEWSRTPSHLKDLPSGCCHPPVYPASPHQRTDFSSRSMNAFHPRSRVSEATKLNTPPLPNPITSSEVKQASTLPPIQTQRPPSNSTNCTGLINLLGSPSSPSSNITSSASAPSQETTCLNAPGNVSSSCSPNLPLAATAKTTGAHFSSPSLSELTDRLQMPPPSLPPPSALRRSAKLSLSRCSIAPSSPSSKSNSPFPSNTATSTTASSAVSVAAFDGFTTSPCKLSILSSNETKNTKSNVTSESSDLSETAGVTVSQYHNDSTSKSVAQSDCRSPASQCNALSEPCRSAKIEEKVHSSNGTCPETKFVTSSEYLQPKKNDFLSSTPHLNGLRPGILQAAVDALDDSKLDKLSKFTSAQEGLVNGFLVDSATCGIIRKSKMDIDSPLSRSHNCVGSIGQVHLNGVEKSLPVSEMNGHARGNGVISLRTCAVVSPTISPCKYSVSSSTILTNGLSNSDSSDSNESSGSDKSLKFSRSSPKSHNRLKRRRKWGSCSRLFNPKRKRNHAHSDSQVDTCIDPASPQAITKDIPLNSSPLQLGTLPDSVLAPTWKSPWSPVSSTDIETCTSTHPDSGRGIESNMLLGGPPNPVTVLVSEISKVPTQDRLPHKYLCEWENCSTSFKNKDDVAVHVYHAHLATLSRTRGDGIQMIRHCCHWRNCTSSSLARAPFALLTHVLDIHCNPRELEARKYTTPSLPLASSICDVYQVAKASTASHPETSTTHPQHYHSAPQMIPSTLSPGDQSAWSIVRSLEMKQMQHDMWAAHYHFVSGNPTNRLPFAVPSHLFSPPPREGPVTKHLRVTAALILRNFILYLNEARNWFATELPLLSELAFGCSPSDGSLKTNDAGHIVAQCFALCYGGRSPTQSPVSCPSFFPSSPLYSKPFVPTVPRHPLSYQHRRHTSTELQLSTHTVDLDAKYV